MASDIRRLLFDTRERLTSTDLNNVTNLHHRALIEAIAAVCHGETAQYGVIRGFVATVVPATLTVSISSGLALMYGTAPTTYDSAIEWVEMATAEVIDLTANVDATNPRWAVIEIANADAVETSLSKDVWVPASGTFTSQSVDKVSGSSPTITVRVGTAAVTPYLPVGIAGRIPLAYVYLPAAAATIDIGDIVGCRPVINTSNPAYFTGTVRDIRGGGCFVSSLNTTVGFRECTGYIGDSTIPFSVGRLTATDTISCTLTIPAAGWDGAAFPGVDTPAYFYAIQPPYPAGYSATLADREFAPGSTATARFPALVSQAGMFRNCVVVASTSVPNVADQAGAPVSGNFSITAAPWSNVAISVSRQASVYLGSAMWDTSSSYYITQSYFNKGRVHANGTGGAIVPADLHNGTVWSYIANDTIDLWALRCPVTARELHVVFYTNTGTATGFLVQFETDSGMRYFERRQISSAYNIREYTTIHVDSSGRITLNANGVCTPADTDLADMAIQVEGYMDSIISKR